MWRMAVEVVQTRRVRADSYIRPYNSTGGFILPQHMKYCFNGLKSKKVYNKSNNPMD